MRCVSSRFLTAAPRLLAASMSSAARRSRMFFSPRERALLGALLHQVQRSVEDVLGGALLASELHRVDELCDHDVVELRVRQNLSLARRAFSRHPSPSYFGRLAPC